MQSQPGHPLDIDDEIFCPLGNDKHEVVFNGLVRIIGIIVMGQAHTPDAGRGNHLLQREEGLSLRPHENVFFIAGSMVVIRRHIDVHAGVARNARKQRAHGGAGAFYVVIILRGVIAGAEMHLDGPGGNRTTAVMRAAQGAVQQLDPVEVRGVGNAVYLVGHGLKFAVDDQTLGGIVRSGRGLFGQFLHADELFVDDGQRAVRRLDQRYGIVGVTDALIEAGHVRPHQFADRQPGRIVRRGIHTQSGRQPLYGCGEPVIMRPQRAGRVPGHKICADGNRRQAPSPK